MGDRGDTGDATLDEFDRNDVGCEQVSSFGKSDELGRCWVVDGRAVASVSVERLVIVRGAVSDVAGRLGGGGDKKVA